jgi:hypothetical protein
MSRLQRGRPAIARDGVIVWTVKGKGYECRILPGICPRCLSKDRIVELPPPVLAEQPDDTTHVCNPALGGCNHGFSLKSDPPAMKRVHSKQGTK